MKGRKTAPTLDVCVRLLKAELSKPRHPQWQIATSQSYPAYGVGLNQ